jgi:hypothetical protein
MIRMVVAFVCSLFAATALPACASEEAQAPVGEELVEEIGPHTLSCNSCYCRGTTYICCLHPAPGGGCSCGAAPNASECGGSGDGPLHPTP